MNTFEIIAILVLALVSLFLWRLGKESTSIKNIQMAVTTLMVVATAHFTYVKLIQEQEAKEKLPPGLNISCKLEKIAEPDACYWLKASVGYENKSERRIYVINSAFNIKGLHVADTLHELKGPRIVPLDSNFLFSKQFEYSEDSNALYARQIDASTSTWLDPNQEANREYMIKIPHGYDVASLTMDVYMANVEAKEISDYRFMSALSEKDGAIYFFTINNSNDSLATNDEAIRLRDKYGVCHTSSISQVFLKDNGLKR